MRKERILIVDDEPGILRLSNEILSDAGFTVVAASNGEQALEKIGEDFVDLMILDERMPGMSGSKVLAEAKQLHPDLAVIIMTAYASVGLAVRVFKDGACDLLTKPVDKDQMLMAVQRGLASSRLSKEVRHLRSLGRQECRHGGLVGESDKLHKVLRLAKKAIDSDVPVLILGETGTGKELLARAFHYESSRSSGPFVVANLNALPEALAESELFGHVKGAFTDANTHRTGMFEIAQGGTIFLDEIGDVSGSLQVKLLRVLQENTVQRVGANEEVEVDARVVAATNKDLKKEIEADRFRQDLFYRLAVFPIEMPALRDRKEDIPILAGHFLERFSQEGGKQVEEISPEALQEMVQYDWPGNVRELEHVIRRAILLTEGTVIFPTALPGICQQTPSEGLPSGWTKLGLDDLTARVERAYLERLLSETNWDTDEAALRADIHRTTLARKLKKYNINPPGS